MATGENAGTWGTKTNTNLDLIQEGWGYTTVDVASTDVTLVMSSGASSNARNFILELTGVLAGNRVVNIPAQAGSPAANIEKAFLVIDKTNRSGSNFSLTFKVTGQTGVLIPANSNIFCYHNGTDIFTSGMLSTRGSAATLAAQPTYTIPSADGTTGQYLKTDGAGALTFATLPAAGISTGVAIAMAIVFG
tara:strand:- start:9 stop:581 length:573 start_codon:yes stop_codon:yes gene_type:complete